MLKSHQLLRYFENCGDTLSRIMVGTLVVRVWNIEEWKDSIQALSYGQPFAK